VNLAVIRLRRQKPDLSRPFSIPYYPVPPILGILLNLLLGLFISPRTWVIAIGWLVFGGLVYIGWRRYNQLDDTDTNEEQTLQSSTLNED
jgi:amino acid transporter